MSDREQHVMETVWPWRESLARDTARRVALVRARRRVGVAQGLVGATVAALLYFAGHRPMPAAIILGLAVLSAGAALFFPQTVYPHVERAVAATGRVLGAIVRWVLLPPVFLLLFWPVGAFRRWRHAALIRRRPDPSLATYWQVAPPALGPESYRRQF